MRDMSGMNVTLMGLGRFGGGLGCAEFLARHGAHVLVTDTQPDEKLREQVNALDHWVRRGLVTFRLGEHNVSDFTCADLVVANPAVAAPWDNRFLRSARAAGVPITTEMGLTLRALDDFRRAAPNARTDTPSEWINARIIAVTGSAGKSTTSAMIAHALAAVGEPVVLAGNIGGSLLDRLPSPIHASAGAPSHVPAHSPAPAPLTPQTWIVLEMSSFMLHWLDEDTFDPAASTDPQSLATAPRDRAPSLRTWSPAVGVVTNLLPNHLDWHASIGHYESCKRRLIRELREHESAVLGQGLEHWNACTHGRCVRVREHAFARECRVPGAHNRVNASAALLACMECAADAASERFCESALVDAIASFPGLPHRLEAIPTGEAPPTDSTRPASQPPPLRFYNDSKSTTPEATLRAVEALADADAHDGRSAFSHVHLIAGGYDKGSDLAPVAALAPRLAGLYTIGVTGPVLAASARRTDPHAYAECHATLDRAVDAALARMRPGDCLLLSPACASWDQFTNYEQRGDRFRELVRAAAAAGTTRRNAESPA